MRGGGDTDSNFRLRRSPVAWHLPVDRNCRLADEAGNRCKRASAFASAGISKSIRDTRPNALTLSGDGFRDVYSSGASDRDISEAVCGGSRLEIFAN